MERIQQNEEWFLRRIGKVTGSRFGDVIAIGKNGSFLKSRETAITEITLELLTGQPGPMWTSKATDWGNEQEPFARMAYEAATGAFVEEVGFIDHPTILQCGASPDGLIEADGGFEAKSPYTPAVHMATLLYGMPAEHMAQCQGGMFVTGRQWWDFVSWHPAFPEGMKLYIQRIERDQKFIDAMEMHIVSAIKEINDNVARLLEKYEVVQ
jgi:hypothetical protein